MMLDFEQRLGLSRRIDWRFLLPEPALRNVACMGAADEQLVAALSHFSGSLTMIDAAGRENGRPHSAAGSNGSHKGNGHAIVPALGHDLVVVCARNASTIECAARHVRPGGMLYVEAARGSEAGTRGRLRRPGDYARLLKHLGLRQVRTHWHWPDFATCSAMVPLDDRSALRHFLNQQGGDGGRRLKSAAAKWMLSCRLLGLVIRNFSIVGARPVA